tara:strand:- start:1545 stop:2006 length:462 start_codon:yes stop_codon:yes gene_type:complete
MSEETGQKHIKQYELFEEDYKYKEDENSKLCTKCNQVKPLTFFPWNDTRRDSEKGYRREHCYQCVKTHRAIRAQLRKKHGMPSEGYICPICLKNEEDTKGIGGKFLGSWVIDHCHSKKSFRGWLCHQCNRALGCFGDDIKRLKRAIKYLEDDL